MRLKLLHRLLAEDGVIFVSLDDVESGNARLLMDEIFGYGNFIAAISWEKRYTRSNNAKMFYSLKDTILTYRKSLHLSILKEGRSEKADANYGNPDKDHRGDWMSASYVNPATKEKRQNLVYPITNPAGISIEHPTHAWKYSKEEHERHVMEKRLWWGQDGTAIYPRLKLFLSEASGMVPVDLWSYGETGTTDEGGQEIREIFGNLIFDTPKPTKLIERALKIATEKSSIVLDTFAGSGTTAHAVLKLNAQDGGNRRFILCEMMDYAETITAERVRRVISGYGEGNKAVAGTGGGFDYYTVGAALFKDDKNLNEDVGENAIRDYVAYAENIPHAAKCVSKNGIDSAHLAQHISPHALGVSDTALWVFYYQRDCITTLNMDFLATLQIKALRDKGKPRPQHTTIYADRCVLAPAFLQKHGIVFKRIPRDITRF